MSYSCCLVADLGVAEKEGNCPDTGQGHQGIDNAAEQSRLAPKQSCHQVELKDPDAAPVQCADDDQCQNKFIKHHNISLSFLRTMLFFTDCRVLFIRRCTYFYERKFFPFPQFLPIILTQAPAGSRCRSSCP